ncbi:hypothetical protein GGS23DRAFT_613053 [Durotheca rogersii]|uniref:uncharacterized protein n=1 Tax=Durotheca rogersii TaxID=419775 RepID=UPI002220401F|nr:uncharacterized protein GGS23DRAFT_613053 [Durotheca rogersii]KAI5860930.1 hypothetical protein GGS23DRAFT_613053 [Durotheca rogersii]
MSLLVLPSELLLQVMGLLRESGHVQSLQFLAHTCKRLRGPAEACLYSVAMFTTLSSLRLFLNNTRAEPRRNVYLRDLRLLYSTEQYDHDQPPEPPDLTSFPSLTTFVSESPECQPWSVRPSHWNVFMDSYIRAFEQGSLLNEPVGLPRPLSSLKSLTLHWTGIGKRYWTITAACPIFLLPRLQSLEISCARIEHIGPIDTGRFHRQTQLESLTFTECTVSTEALHAVLSFPAALRDFALCETFYHPVEPGDRFAVNDVDALNRAIAQQSGSLERLQIHFHAQYLRHGGTLPLSLSDFTVLSHLQIGPFIRVPTNGTHASDYVLKAPAPPRLTSLRLDNYGIVMLREHRVDEILSGLSIGELLANSEARGQSFELSISLERFPPLLRRIRFNSRNTRPVMRRLVERLASLFQRYQEASIQSRPESTLDGPTPHRASSRLRILTHKHRKMIPPFLHNEGPPRFVVRYDSWNPQGFVHDPYPLDIVPLNREISSDDESMDVAFSEAGDVESDYLV